MNTITHDEMKTKILAVVKSAGSQYAAAKQLDISAAYLSDILAGKRAISDSLARKLGFRRSLMYRKEEV